MNDDATNPQAPALAYQPTRYHQLAQGLVVPAVMGSVLVFLVQNAATDIAASFGPQPFAPTLKRTIAYLVAVGYVVYLCLSFLSLARSRQYGGRIFVVDVLESLLGFFAIFAIGFITMTEPFPSAGLNIGIGLIGIVAVLRESLGGEAGGQKVGHLRLAAIALAVAAFASFFLMCRGGRCESGAPAMLLYIDAGLIVGLYVLLLLYWKARFPT